MAERGVLRRFLAERGFTGPERIIEGNKGFAHSLLRGVENYIGKPLPNDYYLMRTRMKFFPTESTNQGHLVRHRRSGQASTTSSRTTSTECMLRLSKRTVGHNGDPAKKYPRNKETADHSAYFITALGIVSRGKCRAVVVHDAAYDDPVIHEPDREGTARARARIRCHHSGGAGHNSHHRWPCAGEAR